MTAHRNDGTVAFRAAEELDCDLGQPLCQHYAASDYWPQIRRTERVTIVGDTPV
jgi:hypothetical protein